MLNPTLPPFVSLPTLLPPPLCPRPAAKADESAVIQAVDETICHKPTLDTADTYAGKCCCTGG